MATDASDARPLDDALQAGNRAFARRDYAEAARRYERIVALDGRCAVAWYNLGNARWRRGDRTGAIDAYRRAVGEDPSRARAWQNLSTAHLSARSWGEAAEAASKAVALDASRAKAWNNLAVARHALGDAAGAEAALRRSVATDAAFGVAWANLGRLLAGTGRPDDARRAFEQALARGETGADVRVGLAHVCLALGDRAWAERVLEEAVRADPSAEGAWLLLGDVRRARGALASAIDAFDAGSAVAEDGPGSARARFARRRIDAGLERAEAAVRLGDRDGFRRACEGLRLARQDLSRSGDADPLDVAEGVARCEAAARARASVATSPDVVAAALTASLGAAAPSRSAGGGA